MRTFDGLLENVLCFRTGVVDAREGWGRGINGKIFVWTDFESESGLGSGDMSIEGKLVRESLGEGVIDMEDWKEIISFGVFFEGIFTRRKFNNLLKFLLFFAGLMFILIILVQVGQMRSRQQVSRYFHTCAGWR